MQRFVATSLMAVLWTACSSDDLPTIPNTGGMGGEAGGSSGAAGSAGGSKAGASSSAGAPSTGGTSAGSGASMAGNGGTGEEGGMGGNAGAGGASGAGGKAGSAGGGMGGSGGAGGMRPDATTCAGYALKCGAFGASASVKRVIQDDFTIEAWIKTAKTAPEGPNFYQGNGLIYADIGGAHDDFGLAILGTKLAFGVGNPDTTLVSQASVNSGNWVHVAATRDSASGAMEIFLFGKSEGKTAAVNKAPLTAATDITIGGNTVDGRYFDGLVDEVRLWDHVRTSAELKATLHSKLLGTEAGLVGYWSFDNADEAQSPDASPMNMPATLVGAVDWVDGAAPVCDPPNAGGTGGAGGGGAGGTAGIGGTNSGGTAGTGGTDSGGTAGTGGSPADPGLVLGYSFDEGSADSVEDFTGNGNLGALPGGRVPGKSGSALKLDDGFVFASLPSAGITENVDDFTVALWVNPSALPDWHRVFDFGTDTDHFMMLTGRAGSTQKPRFELKNGALEAVDSSVELALDTWQHITVTLSGSTATMYIDGVVVGSNTAMTIKPSDFAGNRNWLGHSQYPDARYRGALDSFRIYSRALTANEVKTLAEVDGGDPVAPDGLLLSYDFDEAAGRVLEDSSGSNLDGVISGYDWVARGGGLAAQSDGEAGYITMPADIVQGVNDFTLAAWVYQRSERDWARIIDLGTDQNSFINLIARAGDSKQLRLGIKNGAEEFVLGPTLPTGEWHHVAATRAGTVVTVYMDGAQGGTGIIAQTLPNGGATPNNWLGRSQFPDALFDGSLDDVRIYSRALTAEEILLLAQ